MKTEKRRVCFFAGFDRNGEIADYVVYYIKALSEIADVYYWGDFKSSEKERAKITPFCKAVYCARHGKYDFGSWQELIKKVGRKEIEKYDELILANDSCYGPLFNLATVFDEMNGRNCDFWGLSSAYYQHIHLQSYLIALKQPVLQSDAFYNFFKEVKPETNHDDVCLYYEDRFTYILNKAGFRHSSYIAYDDLDNHPYRDIVSAIKKLHFPLLKVKFFLGDIRDQAGVPDWRKIIQDYTEYPVELIEEDLERRGFDLAEIDHAVQNKRSETPNFYARTFSVKRAVRKTGKIVLRPLMRVIDTYIHSRTAQYFYEISHVNYSFRKLKQKYEHLRSRVDPDFTPKSFHLKSNKKENCNLHLAGNDATNISRFDLELPLTSESDVLLIGNITERNLVSLELYDPHTIFLNNDWEKGLKIHSERTNNLCDFKFVDKANNPVYFDFILVQPLDKNATDKEIGQFIDSLKSQMIFESVLAMMVTNAEVERYEQVLESKGLRRATSERGLVVMRDPFQVYYDKIESVKGYKALIYKIK